MTGDLEVVDPSELCDDTCDFAYDGECGDGGPGSTWDVCEYGTDCSDCGPRTLHDCDTDGSVCRDTCPFAGDGQCDDGGTDALTDLCICGTDCLDCGSRTLDDCGPDSLVCDDTCDSAYDGECDDGGFCSDWDECACGTDCFDCGPRTLYECDTGDPICEDTCPFTIDGQCDDGGIDATTDLCACGTDCLDCGSRTSEDCTPHGDGDGIIDEDDVCDNTPAGTAVDPEGRPLGDLDLDCDTDLDDHALFLQEFTGPAYRPVAACCLPDRVCMLATEAECTGLWQGVGTTCAPNPCTAFVIIDTVPVGNPGNQYDLGSSTGRYGDVAYVYNIGKFEVTAGQYTAFLNAVAVTDTYELYNPYMADPSFRLGCNIQREESPGGYSYSVAPDWANRPVNYVSWGDVARFANWLHNGQPTGGQNLSTTEDGSYYLNGATDNAVLYDVVREQDASWVIPTEDEWYKAAYHKNDGVTRHYYYWPTSSDILPGYVTDSGNLSGTGTAFTEGGSDPGNYATYNGDDGIDGIGSPYHRTEIGEWENSGSPYATFDQGGNVWEWTETTYLSFYRILRGGSFTDIDHYLRAPFHIESFLTDEFPNVGFRVAALP